MSTKPFLGDVTWKYISASCKAKRHAECDGIVYPKEWNEHQHDCDCKCHQSTPEE